MAHEIVLSEVSRSFGAVKALVRANLAIAKGEKIGLIGHNGAGKSTLMNVLAGLFPPDHGEIAIGGERFSSLSSRQAQALGIRCVFQELSLCSNLTAVENALIRKPTLVGFGWRKRARAVILRALDQVFPDHGISVDRQIGDLTIAQRQMIEIALAFAVVGDTSRLVILDEPTSSLDARAAEQLMAYLGTASEAGTATILISHRLQEILRHTDRIVVMVDGQVVADKPAASFTRESLVAQMGHLETSTPTNRGPADKCAGPMFLTDDPGAGGPKGIHVRQGEIVGFAGLDGHGQRSTLRKIFAQLTEGRGFKRNCVSYVSGDRQTEGVFPLWSVADNSTIRALPDISSRGVIDLQQEQTLAAHWIDKVKIKTSGPTAFIGTLSGGNQQKVLFARALASKAQLVLMDDPMRGVDVGTKSEVYRLIRAEAEMGRCFIWYSTELEELRNCDRVYVFREGRVTAELAADEVTEDNILQASFKDQPEGAPSHA